VDKNLLISLGFQEKDLNAIKGKKEDKRLLTYRSEFYCSAVGAIAEPGPRKPNENQNENKKQKMTMIVADTMLNDYYVKVGEYNCDSLAEILRNACKTLR
jgi:hypothetical protein